MTIFLIVKWHQIRSIDDESQVVYYENDTSGLRKLIEKARARAASSILGTSSIPGGTGDINPREFFDKNL
ncbi:hypothetical protein Q3G72_024551 [Acer saccharum]|nr:hypothetical protein Q3G72_024551 [Acer saccharum]